MGANVSGRLTQLPQEAVPNLGPLLKKKADNMSDALSLRGGAQDSRAWWAALLGVGTVAAVAATALRVSSSSSARGDGCKPQLRDCGGVAGSRARGAVGVSQTESINETDSSQSGSGEADAHGPGSARDTKALQARPRRGKDDPAGGDDLFFDLLEAYADMKTDTSGHPSPSGTT
eukprot:TRINITY_DN55899_c0_g1_i1.p1 TRINITY_DN55899_c0_g1~~TRINITY_DN55899_c0_g1_i1.p1  ORF type:complete len:175 (-),score=24.17 TRINITY_DN55899_c0_g1_i1:236-760(-)